MRRTHASAAIVLGLAIAVFPGAGFAADQPSRVPTADDCGAGAYSETFTIIHNGEPVTIISDNFGDCLTSVSRTVAAQSTLPTTGAAPAVPVPGRPAFTG